MQKHILSIFTYIVIFSSLTFATTLPDATITIYIDDHNGERIATGKGVVIAEDGLVATDINLLLAWLQADDNSLFVRTAEGSYYPLQSLVLLERDVGVGIFRISIEGPISVVPASATTPPPGSTIYIAGDTDDFGAEPVEGAIRAIRANGVIELSVPMPEGLRGAPVMNVQGQAVGIASVGEGVALAVPINRILALADEGGKITSATQSTGKMAITKAEAILQSNKASAEDYLRLGMTYVNAGIANDAAAAFIKAIQMKPDYAEAYHGLGIAYASKGLYEDAASALEQAVAANPNYAKALGNLGFIYDYLGKHDDAVASFARAIELQPEYAEAYNGLGVSYARAGNYEEAISAFRHALRIRPELKKPRFNLGLSYINLGNKESAFNEEALLRILDPEMADRLHELIVADEEFGVKELDSEELDDQEIGADVEKD